MRNVQLTWFPIFGDREGSDEVQSKLGQVRIIFRLKTASIQDRVDVTEAAKVACTGAVTADIGDVYSVCVPYKNVLNLTSTVD